MKTCRCCAHSAVAHLFSTTLLDFNVSFYECKFCGYVQTEDPFWLHKAYSSPINVSDTGIISRNLSNVSLVFATLALMGQRKSQVVDFAGGYGFLVRLLRDSGIDALWADPYCTNLVARGFEYQCSSSPVLVTAFEAYEHFVSPIEEMDKLLAIAPNILLTTSLIPTPTPKPDNWWYYGLDHGQHIGFYRIETLKYLANKYNLYLLSDGVSTHLFTQNYYSYRTWFFLRKLANLSPACFRLGLRSKTWNDFLKASETKQS
jgi:hypothetical protein